MPQVAALLGDSVTIWHQVGKGALEGVNQAYAAVDLTQHKVTEFIDDMAAAYAWADVVVCRSGALTVSEIAAAGLPAIFVPFSTKTASSTGMRYRWKRRAPPKFMNSRSLLRRVWQTRWPVGIDRRYWQMAEKARAVAIPDATERVAAEVSKAAH